MYIRVCLYACILGQLEKQGAGNSEWDKGMGICRKKGAGAETP